MNKICLTVFGLFALTGCGQINFVTGAQISSYSSGGDQFAQLAVDLNSAGLILPTLTIPIPDPGNPSREYGSIGLSPAALDITVDISAVAKLPPGGSNDVLPNGSALPLSNVDPSSMLTFPLGSTKPAGTALAPEGSEAYIELNTTKKEAVFGTAIVITQFNIGTQADLFIPFALPNGILGVAGVFTGSQAGKSGFAVFADVSSVLSTLNFGPIALDQVHALHAVMSAPILSAPVSFNQVNPSDEDMAKLSRMLNHLKKNRVQLNVE